MAIILRRFNFRLIARLLGIMLLIVAVSMALPTVLSAVWDDGALNGLLLALGITLLVGLLLRNVCGRQARYELHEQESFWITSLLWIVVPLAGSLPFLLTGTMTSFIDALFESMSGFTTTGSSVVATPEHLPKSLIVWRSMTQWFGGLGLVLFLVAAMRRLNVGSLQLYDAEFSGTLQRKLHPHMAQNVLRMWLVYGLLTLLAMLCLWTTGCGALDAFCLALSTVSTGGFMPSSVGLADYGIGVLIVLTGFMFVSGINLAIIFNFLTGGTIVRWWQQLFRRIRVGREYSKLERPVRVVDEEFVVYFMMFVVAVVCCIVAFVVAGNGVEESMLYSLFHVASTISTCGFFTTEPPQWSFWVSGVTFLLIFVGASAGSTGGGLKLKRIMIVFKYMRNYIVKMVHPNAVFTVRINHSVVPQDYINKIFAFVFLYICFVVFGAFMLTVGGMNIPNAVCMAAANISNLGPSPLINNIGANLDYVMLPTLSKWTVMVLMLAGRLELFALVAILSPAYWRRGH